MKCRLDEGPCPPSNATAAIDIMNGIRDAMAELDSPLNPVAYSYAFLLAPLRSPPLSSARAAFSERQDAKLQAPR